DRACASGAQGRRFDSCQARSDPPVLERRDVPPTMAGRSFRPSPLPEARGALLEMAGLGYTGQVVETEAIAVAS
ncbi:MAG: hypothetical protein KY396_08025, partial [Actinobacteria bacterium]|nr:hypothetical protein [Actinomycetota bacterium]